MRQYDPHAELLIQREEISLLEKEILRLSELLAGDRRLSLSKNVDIPVDTSIHNSTYAQRRETTPTPFSHARDVSTPPNVTPYARKTEPRQFDAEVAVTPNITHFMDNTISPLRFPQYEVADTGVWDSSVLDSLTRFCLLLLRVEECVYVENDFRCTEGELRLGRVERCSMENLYICSYAAERMSDCSTSAELRR